MIGPPLDEPADQPSGPAASTVRLIRGSPTRPTCTTGRLRGGRAEAPRHSKHVLDITAGGQAVFQACPWNLANQGNRLPAGLAKQEYRIPGGPASGGGCSTIRWRSGPSRISCAT